jgi:hypothetical protein
MRTRAVAVGEGRQLRHHDRRLVPLGRLDEAGQHALRHRPKRQVSTIVIEAGQKPVSFEPVYKGPITKWKTSKGVHIGTTLRTVGKKYPKARPDGGGLALQSGRRTTFFSSSLGRTATITIAAG